MKKSLFKKILFTIFFIIFLVHLVFRIYQYRDRFITQYDAKYWGLRYSLSQWSTDEGCRNLDPHVNPYTCQWDDNWYEKQGRNPTSIELKKTSIGDDALYAYVGWKYVNGIDPTLMNVEMPFMGKYILGASILLFRNENIFALLSGIAVLLTLFILNKKIFTSNLYAFLPVLLLSLEPLFYEQLRAPFFDLLHLEFLLLSFLFFLRKQYWIVSLFLGCFAATKFPFMLVLPVATMVIALFINDKRSLKKFILTLPLPFIVYLITYLQYFILGNSFINFLKVQKYIYAFYITGAKAPFMGTVFPLLFSGVWHTHFSSIQRVAEWSIKWPIISLISVISFKFKPLKQPAIFLMLVWIMLYLLFLSLTPLFPRYLLLLLPFLYNLSVWVLLHFIPVNEKK